MSATPEAPLPESPDRPSPDPPSWPGRPRRLLVNVTELRRRLGQRQEQPIDVVLERQAVVGSRSLPRPVIGSATVESIERGVSVLGSITFAWEGECRRCLEPVTGEIAVQIDEIFQVDAPEDSDIIDFDGESIDLVPVLRDAVALSLPLAPLCRPDCVGPDPERYPALTVEERERNRRADAGPDPRWAALDELDLG